MSTETDLINRAKEVRANAYALHSGFSVGAAILDEIGDVHVGCNVENAAYPSGSCAEENAIGTMVAAGGKHIQTIVVIGGFDSEDDYRFCQPCGACRQRIAEFCVDDTEIVLIDSDGATKRYSVAELLPDHFIL